MQGIPQSPQSTTASIQNHDWCCTIYICSSKSTAKNYWLKIKSLMYQFPRQDCSTLCKILYRLIGILCCISSHGLTQCILEYIETIPKITSPMKLKELRKLFKKGYSIYIVHTLPIKVAFVWIFMIDWINLFLWIISEIHKRVSIKYDCLCNTHSALVFLQKQYNTTQKILDTQRNMNKPKKSHKFWSKMLKLIASGRNLTLKTHFI